MPWTVAHQASPSMGFCRQEYWSGLPFPSRGDLPNPGIEPRYPTLEADTLTSEPPGKPFIIGNWNANVGSQEAPGVTDKFGLGVQNEAGQRLIEFCQENAVVTANTISKNRRESSYSVYQLLCTLRSHVSGAAG